MRSVPAGNRHLESKDQDRLVERRTAMGRVSGVRIFGRNLCQFQANSACDRCLRGEVTRIRVGRTLTVKKLERQRPWSLILSASRLVQAARGLKLVAFRITHSAAVAPPDMARRTISRQDLLSHSEFRVFRFQLGGRHRRTFLIC